MTQDEYRQKKFDLLNTIAPNVVKFHKLRSIKAISKAILDGTGSEYLANKYAEKVDFAHRYLNADSGNQKRWLKMMGVRPADSDDDLIMNDCWVVHQAMMFFYNHSLDKCFKSDWLEANKINAYGNGENWCKLWIRLREASKQHVIKFF